MKAILIDADKQTVTDIEYGGTLDDDYKILGCDCIDCVFIDGDIMTFHHAVFVDDVGLMKLKDELAKPGPQTQWYFIINNDAPLLGKGLVQGFFEGENVDVRMTAAQLRPRVNFMRKRFLGMEAREIPNGIMIMPTFGEP